MTLTDPPQVLESLKHFAKHCARTHYWRVANKAPSCVHSPLTLKHLESHLTPGKPRIGLSPVAPGESTTRIAVLDIDDHNGRGGWDSVTKTLAELLPALRAAGIAPHPFRSSGGKGAHVYALWDKPQDAHSVRETLKEVIGSVGYVSGTKGLLKNELEVFPKQDSVSEDGFGSMFVLPMAAESVPIDESTLRLEDPDTIEGAKYWRPSKPVTKLEKPQPLPSAEPCDVDLKELSAALDKIPNDGESSLSYDEWRNVIFAIHHATGGSAAGLEIAEEFSAKSEKVDLDFLRERVWPYVKSGGEHPITAATIFDMARQHEKPEDVIAMFDDLPDDVSDLVEDGEKLKYKIESAFEFSEGDYPGWLIKGVLPQTDLTVMYGVSGAGKSFIALDMACALARGVEWRDKRTKKAKVVYVCAEGVGGFRQRVRAYMLQHEIKADNFDLGILAATPNFLQNNDVRDTIKAIKAYGDVGLVIVDTLAQVTPGGNENSSEDMGMAVHSCQAIHRKTGASVMVVHHAGKDTSKGARGWSGLRAAADAELEIVQTEGQRQVRVRKMKDGRDGAAYPFELSEITIGVDEDGDNVDSCVVEHLDEDELEKGMKKLKGAWETAVYSSLLNLQGLESDDIPLSELAEAVCKRRDVELNYRTRGAVTRAVDALENKGYLAVSDEGRARLTAWAAVPAEMAGEDRVAETYKEPNKKRREFSWRKALLGVLDEWNGQFTAEEIVSVAIKRRKSLGDIPNRVGKTYGQTVLEHMEALISSGECERIEGRVYKLKVVTDSVEDLV